MTKLSQQIVSSSDYISARDPRGNAFQWLRPSEADIVMSRLLYHDAQDNIGIVTLFDTSRTRIDLENALENDEYDTNIILQKTIDITGYDMIDFLDGIGMIGAETKIICGIQLSTNKWYTNRRDNICMMLESGVDLLYDGAGIMGRPDVLPLSVNTDEIRRADRKVAPYSNILTWCTRPTETMLLSRYPRLVADLNWLIMLGSYMLNGRWSYDELNARDKKRLVNAMSAGSIDFPESMFDVLPSSNGARCVSSTLSNLGKLVSRDSLTDKYGDSLFLVGSLFDIWNMDIYEHNKSSRKNMHSGSFERDETSPHDYRTYVPVDNAIPVFSDLVSDGNIDTALSAIASYAKEMGTDSMLELIADGMPPEDVII